MLYYICRRGTVSRDETSYLKGNKMKFENGKLVYLEYEARRGERLLGKCSRRDLPEFLETLSAPCTIFKIVWRIDPKGEADPERKEKEVARK